MIGIRVHGVGEIERALDKLERKARRKIIASVLREHAKSRIKPRIERNLSGRPVEPQTGRLRRAMASAPVRAAARRPSKLVRLGVTFPTRAELGLEAGEAYYPAIVEYGHATARARPFLRPAVDDHKRLDRARIGRAIGRRLELEWNAAR